MNWDAEKHSDTVMLIKGWRTRGAECAFRSPGSALLAILKDISELEEVCRSIFQDRNFRAVWPAIGLLHNSGRSIMFLQNIKYSAEFLQKINYRFIGFCRTNCRVYAGTIATRFLFGKQKMKHIQHILAVRVLADCYIYFMYNKVCRISAEISACSVVSAEWMAAWG